MLFRSLMIQKYLGGEPADYWKADTPVFHETARTIAAMAETERMKIGVDGCGVPVFAVGMKNIAISFKNLACPDRIRGVTVHLDFEGSRMGIHRHKKNQTNQE